MDEKVTVTVAITAHSRERYISRALQSVFAQTLDPGMYEVVIVTDSSSVGVAPKPAPPSVRVIRMSDQSMGRKLAQAIRSAHGSIVSFLDDDDVFAPNKLAWVVRQFRTDSRLGLLHNGLITVDDEERPFMSGRAAMAQTRRRIEVRPGTRLSSRSMEGIFRYMGNMSSVSLRKEWSLPILGTLDRMQGNPEGFFAAGALRQGVAIVVDPMPLTYYRLHTSSAHTMGSDPLFIQRRAQYFRRAGKALDELLDFTKTSPTMHKILRSHRIRWSLYQSLYDHEPDTALSDLDTRDLLRFLALDRGREATWLIPMFMLSRLFPNLSARVLRAFS